MGIVGLIILIIIISFIGVTVMGWDNFIELTIGLGEAFVRFVEGGLLEIKERVI